MTSTSSEQDRMQAANQVVANFNVKAGSFAVLTRSFFTFFSNTKLEFTVIYADNSYEKWQLNPSSYSSLKVLTRVEKSLKNTDDTSVKPSPNCDASGN
ncbi:hypothetical protein [Undibacterium flavidum]|uniref:Uncharacterized protein n=1 Tax=Undibacterium flavidum TaxID=2762297 RepID=A0ABR6YBP3_9BURK|nr:hypothetical protein [Undibacterium flavidum]MBC3874062.1 hypothetical protein [Undibacterium flavidum]